MFDLIRWTRTHTIWLLIAVALIPALLVGAVFDGWEGAPAVLRGIVLAGAPVCTLAAVYLIIARRPDSQADEVAS